MCHGCASSMGTFGRGSTCGHSTDYDGIVHRSWTSQVQLSSHYFFLEKIFFLKGGIPIDKILFCQVGW